MRITVGTIVGLVASGASFEEILQLYPIGIRGYSGGGSLRRLAIRGVRNALADRLKILLDMNLSPSWIASLESYELTAIAAAAVGAGHAAESVRCVGGGRRRISCR